MNFVKQKIRYWSCAYSEWPAFHSFAAMPVMITTRIALATDKCKLRAALLASLTTQAPSAGR